MKEEWKQYAIGEICYVIAGQSPKGENYNNQGDGLPFYQGKKDFGAKYICPPNTWTSQITKEAEADDILISVRAPVGPINFATQKICIGRGLAAIRAKNGVDHEFLFYGLLQKQSEISGNEGAVFASINKRQIEDINFPLPPLSEQKRIVAILDEAFEGIDKVVANTKKNLANARELFDSYLNNIFTQKGDGWKEVKLGEVCKIARGGSPRPIKAFLTDGTDGINWIKISDATASTKYIYETKQKIKPEGVKRSRLVHDGDFLLSNSMSFGHPYIMRTSGCIHDGWLVLSDKSGLFDQDYLYYYLGSPEAYRQFDDRAAGSTVRNLNIDSAKSVDVPLPSLPEQNHIVAKLDVLRVETQRLEAIYQQKLTALTELKQSFLQRAFTGELTAEDKTTKIEAVA